MATGGENEFLVQSAIYLGATTLAVPLFRRLKMGTILGFLAAGLLLGPSGLDLLRQEDGVFHVAELGVVLFLFVIGLEISFSRLWDLKNTIFGLGLLQVVITGLAIGYGFAVTEVLPLPTALVIGFALAFSSTAFALSLLEERRELNTTYGTKAFSVLLFQDLAVIPLLAAVPFAASLIGAAGDEGVEFNLGAIGIAAAAIGAIIFIGKYVLDAFFKLVAISGSREAFTAAALFVVAATALVMDQVGLSMALGAFLAGVMLAESSFRHQIEADIEPFRELLLGLFFIGVGMQVDLTVVADLWWVVLLGTVGLIVFKFAVLVLLCVAFRVGRNDALKTGAVLSQGGEFAFVVFSLSTESGILNNELATLLSAVVTLSMIATPFIVTLIHRTAKDQGGTAEPIGEDQVKGRVLVVGFGRMGQLVNQVLRNSLIDVTAIDSDPRRIELAARFGTKVYFGDGTDAHLLMTAGARRVDAIVFTISARERLKSAIAAIREQAPNVKILVRVYDRLHEIEMMDVDTDFVVREMFESSLVLAQKTLSTLGFSDSLIDDITAEYRERDRERLLAQRAGGMFAKKDVLSKPFDAIQIDET